MEFHKPKPVHSWRELLTEIGVIVIGVAIALVAEQAVEALHWQERIRDARRAMTIELRDDDGPQGYLRIAARPCFDNQLAAIQGAIVARAKRKDIVPLIAQFGPPIYTWDSVAWNTLQSSDVASHISPEELRSWYLPYSRVIRLDEGNLREHQDVVALRPSGIADEMLSPGEADTMLAAIKRLSDDNRFIWGHSRTLLAGMKSLGVNLTTDQKQRILAGLRKRPGFGDCVVEPSIVEINVNPWAAIPGKP
ncbi:MAG: hypothetical protein JO256_11120 [Alphaproteobacteria bacterium]|nr:hypothetical protein [Alphaproteobacteria bacterium]